MWNYSIPLDIFCQYRQQKNLQIKIQIIKIKQIIKRQKKILNKDFVINLICSQLFREQNKLYHQSLIFKTRKYKSPQKQMTNQILKQRQLQQFYIKLYYAFYSQLINQYIVEMKASIYKDQIQDQHHQQLQQILKMSIPKRIKILLVENLMNNIRQFSEITQCQQISKYKTNFDTLSTSVSECLSARSAYQVQNDVEELEEKIIKMQAVKHENNEDIETMQEELFQMEKIVKNKREYDEFLKKKINQQLQNQDKGLEIKGRGKSQSVFKKNLGTVAQIFNISKWWG